RSKGVALALQLAAKFSEVVDFSVVRDPDRAVFIAHWHVAVGRQVEDGKPPAAETNVGAIGKSPLPQTGIIRTTMRLDVRHPSQHFPVAAISQSGNPTH